MKNPQTSFAPTFLTHIIARINGFSLSALLVYPYCITALNSTSILMVGGKEGYVNVFDFNSKKWEKYHPGIPEQLYTYSYRLSSTITFNKDAKQKLMVLTGKFCLVN